MRRVRATNVAVEMQKY